MQQSTLAELAFGDLAPPSGPITSPRSAPPRQRLLAAIVLGAQGHYAAAATILADLRRGPDRVLASLATSTLASHRRQLGGHLAARALDGEALAALAGLAALSRLPEPPSGPLATAQPAPGTATPGPSRAGAHGSATHTADSDGSEAATAATASAMHAAADPDSLDAASARARVATHTATDPDGLDATGAHADALLGLAADNLALGRIAAARRFAARAAAADGRWRATVRGGWVGAEIELAAGRPGEAVAPARRAADAARARGSRRHIVKSGIVLGVALATAGDPAEREHAITLVTTAATDAEKYELHSLIWVAARVAADLGAEHAEKYRFRSREVLHGVLRRADPCTMRIALASPWVPTGPG